MPRVIVVQVVFNNRPWIEPVFSAIFNQTYKDFNVVAVISGNDDGSKELIQSKFPEAKSRTVDEFLENSDSGTGIEIIDPGYNIGFAKGHNLVFEKYHDAEFFQLVNPDMIMQPDYIENMLKGFEDEKVGAATGKLYQMEHGTWNMEQLRKSKTIDTTGVEISKSGRARDRGQYELDIGQYDASAIVDAVSGAGAMYRHQALKAVKILKSGQWSVVSGQKLVTSHLPLDTSFEFFDEDFHSYWEDVDLSWRMKNKGWKNVFVPSAVGYHGRAAGSSKNGYSDVLGFIKHHRALPEKIRQLNYKNHIFMYIKNSPYFYPQFFVREFFMLIYILLFEISTLKVLPEFLRQLPKIWKKKKLIYP